MILILVVGYAAGVLVNYLSDILPQKLKIAAPICVTCGQDLPVTTFLTWKKCASCGRARIPRHWLVTIGYIIIAIWQYFIPHHRLGTAASVILFIYLGIVFVIDVEYRLIISPTIYAGVVICGAAGIYMHGLVSTALGGIVGLAVMYALYAFGNLFGKWLAKRQGVEYEKGTALGFGDVGLACVLGLLLGWPGITAGIFLAIILAGVISLLLLIILSLKKSFKPLSAAIPYAPYLILSTILLLFFLSSRTY